ncbi:hypothetical protein C8R44DRAFT_741952 [Mycena epipterygia]|nr:hypothetical protein C8R44DRAFT_741952 [Mycena epipterygia]
MSPSASLLSPTTFDSVVEIQARFNSRLPPYERSYEALLFPTGAAEPIWVYVPDKGGPALGPSRLDYLPFLSSAGSHPSSKHDIVTMTTVSDCLSDDPKETTFTLFSMEQVPGSIHPPNQSLSSLFSVPIDTWVGNILVLACDRVGDNFANMSSSDAAVAKDCVMSICHASIAVILLPDTVSKIWSSIISVGPGFLGTNSVSNPTTPSLIPLNALLTEWLVDNSPAQDRNLLCGTAFLSVSPDGSSLADCFPPRILPINSAMDILIVVAEECKSEVGNGYADTRIYGYCFIPVYYTVVWMAMISDGIDGVWSSVRWTHCLPDGHMSCDDSGVYPRLGLSACGRESDCVIGLLNKRCGWIVLSIIAMYSLANVSVVDLSDSFSHLSVPVEIWTIIAHNALAVGAAHGWSIACTRRDLCLTSRFFKNMIYSDPSFWSYIEVGSNISLSALQIALSRTQGSPLRVHLCFTDVDYSPLGPLNDDIIAQIDPILHMLGATSSRWEGVEISTEHPFIFDHIQRFCAELCAPELKSVNIDYWWYNGFNAVLELDPIYLIPFSPRMWFGDDLPNLRSLQVVSANINWFTPSLFRHIVLLELVDLSEGDPLSWAFFEMVFSVARDIRELRVSNILPFNIPSSGRLVSQSMRVLDLGFDP